MRMLLMAFGVAAGLLAPSTALLAGQYVGTGLYQGTPSSQITSIFNAYPNGGEAMTAAIAAALTANPALADDVAFLSANGSSGQQSAAGLGMARAIGALNAVGNTGGMARIRTAAFYSGSSLLLAAFRAGALDFSMARQIYVPTSNPTATCTNTGSPNVPC